MGRGEGSGRCYSVKVDFPICYSAKGATKNTFGLRLRARARPAIQHYFYFYLKSLRKLHFVIFFIFLLKKTSSFEQLKNRPELLFWGLSETLLLTHLCVQLEFCDSLTQCFQPQNITSDGLCECKNVLESTHFHEFCIS